MIRCRRRNALILIGLLTLLLFVLFFKRNDQTACAGDCGDSSASAAVNIPDNETENAASHLAVIVPFRNRFDELMLFVPHMTTFLNNQKINFTLHIMNQGDDLRFNRAALVNAGFSLVGHKSQYIAIHDVDLLPLDPHLSYRFPGHGTLFHVSSPELHPVYHYASYLGGILLITSHDFESVDGMSNRYYGWGLEDDEFSARVKEKGLQIKRPKGINQERAFVHNHKKSQKRDTAKLFDQMEVTKRRDRETGLHNVMYRQIAERVVTISGSPCVVHDIELICDRRLTPWCEKTSASKAKTRSNSKKSR